MGNIAAIILAAGASSRMGSQKMLLPWTDHQYMAAHTISRILQVNPGSYTIVASEETFATLAEDFTNVIVNPNAHLGMTTSIQAGVKTAGKEASGFMICLADMPIISSGTYMQLIAAFNNANNDAIIQPVYEGKPGHPVIFASTYYNDILGHSEMEGCREIVQKNKDKRILVDVNDPGIHADIDTPETYERLRPIRQ